MGLSFPDQNVRAVGQLLAALYQDLRCVAHVLRALPQLGGQLHAAEDVRADAFGEVTPTTRAQVRTAPAKDIRGQLREAVVLATRQAVSDGVVRTEDEEHRSLFRSQALSPLAVDMRQVTFE